MANKAVGPGGNAVSGVSGEWAAEREKSGRTSPRVWVRLLGRDRGQEDAGWVPLPGGEPVGLAKDREVRFDLRRDAGTLHCVGTFDGAGPGARGKGSFSFESNPRYVLEMESLGYHVGGGEKLLDLAWRDVSLDFVREVKALGYRSFTLDQLLELRSHAVSAERIRELHALGYRDLPASRLVEFSMYDVTPAFIHELGALGYQGLPAERLVEMRIQNVTPQFIRDLAAVGYRGLPAERLVEFRIAGVDAAFVRDLQNRGYGDLSPADLVGIKNGSLAPGTAGRQARRIRR